MTSILAALLSIKKYLTVANKIRLLIQVRKYLIERGVMKPVIDTTPVLPPNHPDKKVDAKDTRVDMW